MELLKKLGEKYGKTVSQVALNWVICKDAVPIVGVKSVKQIEENIGSIGWRLEDQDIKKLDALSKTSHKFGQEN